MTSHGLADVRNYFAALEYRFAGFSGMHSCTISIGLVVNNSTPCSLFMCLLDEANRRPQQNIQTFVDGLESLLRPLQF
jgi:hypothetical protein